MRHLLGALLLVVFGPVLTAWAGTTLHVVCTSEVRGTVGICG